jgi:hypothetical protein
MFHDPFQTDDRHDNNGKSKKKKKNSCCIQPDTGRERKIDKDRNAEAVNILFES